MKKLIFLVLPAVLTGCTSMLSAPEDANRVPASRLYDYSKKSDALLVVMLESKFETGCRIRLVIDGKPAADFFGGEIAYFGVTIGAHVLEAQPNAKCTKFEASQTKVNMKAGDVLLKAITASAIEPVAL